MSKANNRLNRLKRQKRTRMKVGRNKSRLRLTVFRSNRHIYAQVIDDRAGRTLVSASDNEVKVEKGTKSELSAKVGELLALKAKKAKATKVFMDRGGYKYQGRVKELAEAARSNGMEF